MGLTDLKSNHAANSHVLILTKRMSYQSTENKLLTSMLRCLFICVVLVFSAQTAHSRDVVKREKSNKAVIEEREAIVILSGFGSLYHSTRNQVKNFQGKGFDLFIPDYISRSSLEDCSENLEKFISKHKLKSYKKVHVFSYIIGGWTLNTYLKTHEWQNLSSIVYDRSPLQETLPGILSREKPTMSRVLFGKLIKELAETPYFPSTLKQCKVGLLIETKATKTLYHNKESFMKLPEVSYVVTDFQQQFSDYFYTYQSHDDLYVALEFPAPKIISFFKTGTFGSEVERVYQLRNPFEVYEKK